MGIVVFKTRAALKKTLIMLGHASFLATDDVEISTTWSTSRGNLFVFLPFSFYLFATAYKWENIRNEFMRKYLSMRSGDSGER